MADFVESFDNGVGALNHVWGWGGGNIDTSVRGQVTLTGTAGFMEMPYGRAAGHGYGSYTVVAEIHGDTEGSAALLWPGDDKWPGPEYDIVEVVKGQAYGTVHHNEWGRDGYATVTYGGLDESKVHSYTLDWQPGRITMSVDGHTYGSITQNVGADYAHGGVNEVFGLMNRSWATSMTVYEVSYTAGGSAAPAAAPAAAPPPAGNMPSWWGAWSAAWDAHANDGNTNWQGVFWNTLSAGGDIWQV